MLNYLADQKAHNESMYLSAAENKDKYSEARYAGKMDAYRDIFDMMNIHRSKHPTLYVLEVYDLT